MLQPHPPHSPGLPYLRLGILLCPSFTLTPVASFIDAFRLAADREDRSRQIYYSWDFIGSAREPVRASCGLEVTPNATTGDLDRYDCLVLCGGLLRDLPAPSPRLQAHLRKAAEEGKPIVALCTGSFLLAQAGLLDGRRCAVHFDVLGEFARRFPKALPQSGSNYINDRNIITCPGSIVAIDVAAYLISRSGDPARARKSLNYLLFKPNDGVSPATRHRSEALSRASRLTVDAVRYMEFRLDSPCTIDEVAAALNTTRTRLGRSFQRDLQMSPAAFWRDIRLEAACTLLGAARRSISEVAFDLGFCDSAHFCRAFKARWGMTPDEFRRGQRPAGTAEQGG
ncbi:GlxA family transcriptional regulator [Poseidonocella sp. HB161398]|uniref:GlxA family transcriptional regulator n=1 Tax=Poseidonocella sp. HB161398 TaxID=2320855 RepID=UPI0011097769|nr:helix-turn-helix domain-containing protein [Poseidonocella sp. HB161398]